MTDFAQLAIGIDTKDVKNARNEMGKFVKAGANAETDMNRRSASIGRGFAKIAAGVGIAVAAVGSLGVAVRGIAEFEKAMSKVEAISGATGRQLDDLRKKALELGSTTEFSAGQAADALGFLSMAGFDASESLAAIPSVLDLATASGLDLASSADIASNVLSGFGMSANEAGRAADVLAEAASSSNANVGQLGSAMSTVAPISAALGISLEETAAAIGTMSDAGIQGERAGTALRGVLSSLAGPTDAAAGALATYGLAVEDVNPETKTLTEIMKTLAERGLTTADAMTIFGREAASGALVMAGAAQSMGELTGKFQIAEGAASAMAATMRDNLGGDISGLRPSIEGLILSMGDAGLTAIIRGAVKALTAMVRGMTSAVTWLGEMQGYVIAVGAVIVASYVPSIVAAAYATWGLVAANAAYIAGLITLRRVLISTGIGAIVVAVGYLINQFIKLAEGVGGVGNALTALGELSALTFQGVRTVVGSFGEYWRSFASSIKAIWFSAMLVVQNEWIEFLNTLAIALKYLPGMRKAFNAVAGAAFEAASKASAIEVKIQNAQKAAASFKENAGTMLSTAFDPALKKAGQLLAIVNSVGSMSVSGGPDDGFRGGQDPNRPIITIPEITIPGFVMPEFGGGGGAGGGGPSAEDRLSALDALLNGTTEQTPTEKVEAWYAEVSKALADANLLERGMLQEHADYKLKIEQSYQDQLSAIQANERMNRLNEIGNFFGAMGQLTEAGGKKLAKIAAVASGAQTMIAAYEAAMKAAAEAKTIPGRLAAYALFVAKGAQTVQAINKAGSSGTAAAAAPASASAPSIDSPQAPTQTHEFLISGSGVNGLSELVSQLNEAARQGHIVRVAQV